MWCAIKLFDSKKWWLHVTCRCYFVTMAGQKLLSTNRSIASRTSAITWITIPQRAQQWNQSRRYITWCSSNSSSKEKSTQVVWHVVLSVKGAASLSKYCVGDAPVLHDINDDFWDYDKQVDLEAFSSKQLFSELSDQSQRVISTIGSQNEQVSCDYGVHR